METLRLGQKIQSCRLQRGLSIRKLATLAGITPSMLSQLENEQVNPSVNTLRAIAGALDIPMYALFQAEETGSPVIHPEERRIIGSKSEPDVRYELLTRDTRGTLEFCMFFIPPRSSSYRDACSHPGEEVALLLSGSGVQIDLNGTIYDLDEGDSLRIPPNVPHVWHNRSDSTVQIVFAVTPPTF